VQILTYTEIISDLQFITSYQFTTSQATGNMPAGLIVFCLLFCLTYSQGTQDCIQFNNGYSWNQGQNGKITLTFPQDVQNWEIILKFNNSVNSLSVYQGETQRTDSTTFSVKNKSYNGNKNQGDAVELGWQALFDDGSPSQLTSVEFVGFNCGSTTKTTSKTTTTETTSTTTPVSTTDSTTEPTTDSSTAGSSSPGVGSPCTVGVEYTNEWNTGLEGSLAVQAQTDLAGWELKVVFTKSLTSSYFYTASSLSLNANAGVVEVENYDYNANLSAGNILNLDWQVGFDSQTPAVESVWLNGVNCQLSAPSTTETAPSTTETTQSTTSTTATTTSTSVSPFSTESTVITTTSTESTTSEAPGTATSEEPSGSCEGITKYDYDKVLELSNLFYQAQRSGDLDVFGDFNHEKIAYRGNSALDDQSADGKDLSGGYYDAGDYVKFNFPMAAATTLLAWGALDFQSGYKASGEMNQTLNTIKWATDYLIKCHTGTNELYAQVGDGHADHSHWTRAEDMNIARPSFKIDANNPGSDLAGETAAALAAASLPFKGTLTQKTKIQGLIN